ncbi:MAG: TetR/AcrR family transcriptional regulator [Armatimonadota bacterium]
MPDRETSRGSRRRRLLLQSAKEHFSSKGYGHSTTRSIAESTGVTEAVLFQYFATKRELFETCLSHFAPETFIDIDDGQLDQMAVSEAISAIIRSYLDCVSRHQQWFGMLVQECARDINVRDTCHEYLRPVGDTFADFLHQREDNGDIPEGGADSIDVTVRAAVRGFVHRLFREPPEDFAGRRDRFVGAVKDVLQTDLAG